jgi:hypothetical protein
VHFAQNKGLNSKALLKNCSQGSLAYISKAQKNLTKIKQPPETLFILSRAISKKPNVAVEWLKPLLHIREVPGSNLDPETGYPD